MARRAQLTRSGHTDIDFGHFLGHYKSKLGVARETTPFVFTDAQAQVLGGIGSPLFKKFKVDRAYAQTAMLCCTHIRLRPLVPAIADVILRNYAVRRTLLFERIASC